MDALLWVFTGLMAFALAYTLLFSSATLSMGREFSEASSGRGFQDAISPPWVTNLGLVVYLCSALIVGLMWWETGFLSAVGSAALILFGSSIAKLVLPKPNGDHYRNLILRSMMSRYANYVRDSDTLRAEAMGQLLKKSGFDPAQTFRM